MTLFFFIAGYSISSVESDSDSDSDSDSESDRLDTRKEEEDLNLILKSIMK